MLVIYVYVSHSPCFFRSTNASILILLHQIQCKLMKQWKKYLKVYEVLKHIRKSFKNLRPPRCVNICIDHFKYTLPPRADYVCVFVYVELPCGFENKLVYTTLWIIDLATSKVLKWCAQPKAISFVNCQLKATGLWYFLIIIEVSKCSRLALESILFSWLDI